ncbi:MAG: FAD-dependent monooxygenase [Candidatus Rhabdochlamydia sp.]
MDDVIEVLVIGAGPTGMMMAAEAARYGLSCRIIDKGGSYADRSRAIGVQARTMEIFGHLKIAQDFLAQGIQIQAADPISHFRRLAQIPLSTLRSPYPFVLSLEQAKTEEILARYAATLGVRIEKGIECVQLMQSAQEVEVVLQHRESGKEEKVKASWVIGCDGAHSQVRKQLGLIFEGKAFADIFSLADVHILWDYPHNELSIFLNAKGFLAAIPLPEPNRYRLIFQLLRCRNLLKDHKNLPYGQVSKELVKEPNLQEIENLLQEYAGQNIHLTNPIWMANFHINSRMTNTYQKGRVFLAGDAAHIHSPIGAQGMNTGLQDVFNLAWKLALVHKNKASSELLKTYDLERHRVGKTILKTTEYASYMATMHNPIAIWLRNHIISFLNRFSFIRKSLAKRVSQTAIRYPKSFIVVDKGHFQGPKAGLRAPNAPILFKEKPSDLYTIWSGSTAFQMLLFNAPESLQRFGSEFIHVISITPSMDPTGEAHQIYGAKTPCVYIIRPDGYIGYRNKGIDALDIKAYFNSIFKT